MFLHPVIELTSDSLLLAMDVLVRENPIFNNIVLNMRHQLLTIEKASEAE